MKNMILTVTLAAAAVFTIQVQPVAACAVSNGVADGHSVLMFGATFVFAIAAGAVTLFTVQPQSAAAHPDGGDGGGQGSAHSLSDRLALLTRP